VLEQPNVTLRIDDGRNYLLMTSKQYDVITADIIQPFHAGAGNLYSREYFELAAARLRDPGVMVQWIGRRPETQYRLMARTFQAVFPETTVWADGTVLVGRKTPLTLSLSHYRARLTSDLRGPLAFAGIFGFGGLMSRYVAGPEELRRFVGDGPLLTDDRPRMEFFRSLPGNEPDAAIETMRGTVDRHFVE
jgi:spermidine synthase